MQRNAIVERLDQRLNNRGRSVERERVAPRFQKMRRWNMPMTLCRGFVRMDTMVHAQLHFLESTGETEVSGRVVDRISAQYN